jgi:hypothetical protein
MADRDEFKGALKMLLFKLIETFAWRDLLMDENRLVATSNTMQFFTEKVLHLATNENVLNRDVEIPGVDGLFEFAESLHGCDDENLKNLVAACCLLLDKELQKISKVMLDTINEKNT